MAAYASSRNGSLKYIFVAVVDLVSTFYEYAANADFVKPKISLPFAEYVLLKFSLSCLVEALTTPIDSIVGTHLYILAQ